MAPPPLNDPRIRLSLIPYLLTANPTLWVREEMGFNGCVADLVTVSKDEIHVYEIKSDVDTTSRLGDRIKVGRRGRTWTRKGQVTAYNSMADRVTLVVGTKLLEEVTSIIPPWWGILVAVDEFPETILIPHRAATPNPDLRWVNVFKFLWWEEAHALCEALNISRGVKGKSKAKVKAHLKKNNVPLDVLRAWVRRCLRARVWGKFKSKRRR